MRGVMMRAIGALLALSTLFAVPARADIDPAARGIAIQAKQIALAPLRPNTIDALGDSWVAQIYADSTQRSTNANNIINQINAQYGQRIKLGANYGVSGQRVDEYLARLPQLLNSSGGWVWIGTSVNSLAGAGGVPETAAQIWNGNLNTPRGNPQSGIGLKAAFDQVLGTGKKLLIFSEVGAVGFSTSQVTERDNLNQLKREYAEQHAGVFFFDINKSLLNPTASTVTFKTGMSGDGTHLITLGAYTAAASPEGQEFASKFPPLPSLVTTANEAGQTGYGVRNLNPLFTTTTGGTTNGGGTFTGTAPANWTITCPANVTTGITYAAGVVGNDMTLTMSSTVPSIDCSLRYNWTVSQWAVGDIIQDDAQVSVAAGSVGFLGPYLQELIQVDGVNTISYGLYTITGFANGPTVAYTYTMRTKPLAVPAFTTFGQHTSYLRFPFGTSCSAGTPCSATVTIRQFSIRARYGF